MDEFKLYDNVLIEWSEDNWREATIIDIWANKYFIKIHGTEIMCLTDGHDLRKVIDENSNKFF